MHRRGITASDIQNVDVILVGKEREINDDDDDDDDDGTVASSSTFTIPLLKIS